jgi:hypothetical protein
MIRTVSSFSLVGFTVMVALALFGALAHAEGPGPELQRAIKEGVRFLKAQQRADGSWDDADIEARTGTTSLATLALLAAGEPPVQGEVASALKYLRGFTANDLRSTYAVALQTMVFAAADPAAYRAQIASNARWLQLGQIRPGDRVNWPGSWTYSPLKTRNGDSSNTHYALLGLEAARDAGVQVHPAVWALSRNFWEQAQRQDGGWGYTPNSAVRATGSMTCAGISSLIITRPSMVRESLSGNKVQGCVPPPRKRSAPKNPAMAGEGHLHAGLDWLQQHLRVDENPGAGQQWRYYYLRDLQLAGRFSRRRFFGEQDWYQKGAEKLIQDQDAAGGFWEGVGPVEGQGRVVATSFALLFLSDRPPPTLIVKLRHGPGDDWNSDPDDVSNLVEVVSRDWRHRLSWDVVDLTGDGAAPRAPVLFLNGHEAPELTKEAKQALRRYVELGGFLFAEACCGKAGFDRGFRSLMQELFAGAEEALKPLDEDHSIWRIKYPLKPEAHQLWGIKIGDRTAVVYSPLDLSCFWNLAKSQPNHKLVERALQVGQNVVDYATGRKIPSQ